MIFCLLRFSKPRGQGITLLRIKGNEMSKKEAKWTIVVSAMVLCLMALAGACYLSTFSNFSEAWPLYIALAAFALIFGSVAMTFSNELLKGG